MVKMEITYEGTLHCRVKHVPSGAEMATDAPKDNMGKGETFSPTDLVASALASCMLTTMGIVAQRHSISIEGTTAGVTKEMTTAPPRKIARLSVTIQMAKGIPVAERPVLERAAMGCPVHKSLHPDVEIPVKFEYAD